MGVAVWHSNVLATVLLIVAGYLVHIYLTGLQMSWPLEVLVLPFGLPGILPTVLN